MGERWLLVTVMVMVVLEAEKAEAFPEASLGNEGIGPLVDRPTGKYPGAPDGQSDPDSWGTSDAVGTSSEGMDKQEERRMAPRSLVHHRSYYFVPTLSPYKGDSLLPLLIMRREKGKQKEKKTFNRDMICKENEEGNYEEEEDARNYRKKRGKHTRHLEEKYMDEGGPETYSEEEETEPRSEWKSGTTHSSAEEVTGSFQSEELPSQRDVFVNSSNQTYMKGDEGKENDEEESEMTSADVYESGDEGDADMQDEDYGDEYYYYYDDPDVEGETEEGDMDEKIKEGEGEVGAPAGMTNEQEGD